MPTLTPGQLRELVGRVGINEPTAQNIAVAIALAESGGRYNEPGVCPNQAGCCWGLWQIHAKAHRLDGPRLCSDNMYNAAAMYKISKGGQVWQPWEAYTNGAYKKFLGVGEGKAGEGTETAVGDVVGAAAGGVGDVLGAVGTLANVLTNPDWWKRIGVGLGGIALVVVGGMWVLKDVAGPALSKVPGPVGAAAKVVT